MLNKTVLITGASKGIGAETALFFAEKGYNIVINYNNSEKQAKNVQEKISKLGARSIICKADITNEQEVQNMIIETLQVFGKIDVLVNNAGIAEIKPFVDLTSNDYDKILNTNLKGIFLVTKTVVPNMISNQSGKIINLSSVWGIAGSSCEVLYSTAKAGIIGFTKSLAKELGPSNINVNCVAPGFIDTEMNNDITENIKQEIIEETPLEKIGTPKEVASTIYFLASEDSKFITGHVLNVSGGWVI